MKLKYEFDSSYPNEPGIIVRCESCYLIIEQDAIPAYPNTGYIRFNGSDIPDLIKALQSFIAGE